MYKYVIWKMQIKNIVLPFTLYLVSLQMLLLLGNNERKTTMVFNE